MKERSELFNEMYDRLRQMARGRLAIDNRNARGDATSLVHEAYIKLRGWSNSFQDEKHFLATASNAMRQILVDRARAPVAQARRQCRTALGFDRDSAPRDPHDCGCSASRRSPRSDGRLRSARGSHHRDAYVSGSQRGGNSGKRRWGANGAKVRPEPNTPLLAEHVTF